LNDFCGVFRISKYKLFKPPEAVLGECESGLKKYDGFSG
jgi:hypothetical protein